MPTMKTFDAKELREQEMPYAPPEGGAIVSDRIIGHRRWSVDHELIFTLADQPPGTAWRVTYSVGATESQNERPWEYEKAVKATLVREVEKLVKVWEPVAEEPAKST